MFIILRSSFCLQCDNYTRYLPFTFESCRNAAKRDSESPPFGLISTETLKPNTLK